VPDFKLTKNLAKVAFIKFSDKFLSRDCLFYSHLVIIVHLASALFLDTVISTLSFPPKHKLY